MFYTVYDTKGKMFEVPASIVKELLEKGWTPWNPTHPPKFVKENMCSENTSG